MNNNNLEDIKALEPSNDTKRYKKLLKIGFLIYAIVTLLAVAFLSFVFFTLDSAEDNIDGLELTDSVALILSVVTAISGFIYLLIIGLIFRVAIKCLNNDILQQEAMISFKNRILNKSLNGNFNYETTKSFSTLNTIVAVFIALLIMGVVGSIFNILNINKITMIANMVSLASTVFLIVILLMMRKFLDNKNEMGDGLFKINAKINNPNNNYTITTSINNKNIASLTQMLAIAAIVAIVAAIVNVIQIILLSASAEAWLLATTIIIALLTYFAEIILYLLSIKYLKYQMKLFKAYNAMIYYLNYEASDNHDDYDVDSSDYESDDSEYIVE